MSKPRKNIVYAKLLPAEAPGGDQLANIEYATGWAEKMTKIGNKYKLHNCQVPMFVWNGSRLTTVARQLPDREVEKGIFYDVAMPRWFKPSDPTS